MNETTNVFLTAVVSENERAIVQAAATYLARALSQAATTPWTCDYSFISDWENFRPNRETALIITSLLPEIDRTNEPWSQTDQRLRAAYAALAQGRSPIFICTIFRRVVGDDLNGAEELRRKIRRLNLLAAEISRETGAYVIDLDRVLAHLGARRLQTDYRLAGTSVQETAAHFIAQTLLNDGVDAVVSFEIQDAAKEILAGLRPTLPASTRDEAEITLGKNLLALGRGRRKQMVTPVVDAVQRNHAKWLVRQMLQGKLGSGEALDKLVRAVRRRGVRESVSLIFSALSKPIRCKK